MKKYKLILMIIYILLIIIILIYHPIKTNFIYTKKLKLPENITVENENTTVADSVMIKEAKSSLEDLLSIEINEDDYYIVLNYNNIQISNLETSYQSKNLTLANVEFNDVSSGDMMYSFTADINTGYVMEFYQNYKSKNKEELMSLENIEKISKDLFYKITSLSEDEILHFESFLQNEIYISTIVPRNYYKTITIYLDAFDGTVVYYYTDY